MLPSPCDQMATIPLSFMERIDRKIIPRQNSALYPIAQIPAKVTFQLMGEPDGEWRPD